MEGDQPQKNAKEAVDYGCEPGDEYRKDITERKNTKIINQLKGKYTQGWCDSRKENRIMSLLFRSKDKKIRTC